MTNLLDCFGLSDRGRNRPVNEDQFLIVDLDESAEAHGGHAANGFGEMPLGVLLLVADGVGGARAGERASAIVANTVLNQMLAEPQKLCSEEHDRLLSELPAVCHDALMENVAKHPERNGMGSTLTLAHLVWPKMSIVHVGDSRCYLLHHNTIMRLTHDQTVAEYLVEHGLLEPEKAKRSNLRHVLWSLVAGSDCELNPEIHQCELEPGDRLLLCTNGLTNELPDNDIQELLGTASNSFDACKHLLHAATDAGSTDDTTVVVARICNTTMPASQVAEKTLERPLYPASEPVSWGLTADKPAEALAS